MTSPKPTANSYSVSSMPSTAASPLDWGDKCFLCSHKINIDTPPVDSREFWMSEKGGMYLCHSACIQKMHAAGGTPRDFHRVEGARPQRVVNLPPVEPEPPVKEQGAGWLHFASLVDYTAYVRKNDVASNVKVTLGDSYQILQPGE